MNEQDVIENTQHLSTVDSLAADLHTLGIRPGLTLLYMPR